MFASQPFVPDQQIEVIRTNRLLGLLTLDAKNDLIYSLKLNTNTLNETLIMCASKLNNAYSVARQPFDLNHVIRLDRIQMGEPECC